MAGLIQTERVQDLVHFVVQGHREWTLNHVGSQINPLLVVIFNDSIQYRLSISLIRKDIGVEFGPWHDLISRCLRESVLFIIVEEELISSALTISDVGIGRLLLSDQRLLAIRIETVLVTDFSALLHLRAVGRALVVESFLLKDGDNHPFGNDSNESAGSIDHGVRIVVRLEGLLDGFHVGNRRQSD